jgi:Predicted cobalamin binding protein
MLRRNNKFFKVGLMNEYDIQTLIDVLLEGDSQKALAGSKYLFEQGMSAEDIIVEGIEVAMSKLDAKCTLDNFNLLEIMLVGRAAMEVMNYFYSSAAYIPVLKEKIVVASLEGDVHDFGKNILKMVLMSRGYQIIDSGKNCPLAKLIETVEREKPVAVGVSGLISTVIPLVINIKILLEEKGLGNIKVLAGGSVLKQSTPERLNADFVAETAFDALHYLDRITGRTEDE